MTCNKAVDTFGIILLKWLNFNVVEHVFEIFSFWALGGAAL